MPKIDFSTILDRYSREARLYPALLVILPAVWMLLTWFPDLREPLGVLVSIAGVCGAMYLLAQLGRDRGKQIEPMLFEQWGGKPSVTHLRWRDHRIDRHTKRQYHDYLASVVTSAKFPTPAEELADPSLADESYEAATRWLLSKTRDTNVYRLLFKENIAYGFRRNMLGLRAHGIAASLVSALLTTGTAILQYATLGHTPSVPVLIAAAVGWIFTAWWVVGAKASWVRIPADQYALHLLAACTTLAEPAAVKAAVVAPAV